METATKKYRKLKLKRKKTVKNKTETESILQPKSHWLIKSKPTWRLKHANSILESFKYFCQISSKLILTILSYTVSKLMHFLRHSV